MTTLRQALLDRSNDYTELETRYREIAGTDLVVSPWESFGRGPAKLETSASVLIGSYNSAKTLQHTADKRRPGSCAGGVRRRVQ